jgi:hypothetical protein
MASGRWDLQRSVNHWRGNLPALVLPNETPETCRAVIQTIVRRLPTGTEQGDFGRDVTWALTAPPEHIGSRTAFVCKVAARLWLGWDVIDGILRGDSHE